MGRNGEDDRPRDGQRVRKSSDEDIDAEIRFHFEEEMETKTARGLSKRDAEAELRREFGNVTQVKEVTRAMGRWNVMEQLWRDARYAVRTLRKAPLFTGTAVLSLGLGIGANIASFSFADAALFRPIAVARPQEVIAISSRTLEKASDGISYPNYVDIRDRSRSFDGVVSYMLGRFAFTTSPEVAPQMRFGMRVSRGFFSILGVQAAVGRTFTDDESGTAGRDAVIVLSHELWREQFGANPAVIGQTVHINSIAFNVIGVMPEWFTGMDSFLRPAFYLPLTMAARLAPQGGGDLLENRGFHVLNMRARLRNTVTLEQAQAELTAISRVLESEHPEANHGRTLMARTQFQLRVAENSAMAAMVAMLLTLAIMVLVIACANVASLLLARTRARSREIAIRLAIGAGKVRLLSQFLTESLLLALTGGAAGLGMAYGVIRFLAAFRLPTDTPMGIDVRLDERLLLYSLCVSAVSSILFGLAPALGCLRADVAPSLKAVVADGQSRNLGRSVLVAAQVALALVLLVTSSAMLDGFRHMLILDPGIRTSKLMMFEFDPAMIGYTPQRAQTFFKQLIDRARAIPGVRNASLSRAFPFRPNFSDEAIVPEGYQLPANQTSISIATNVVDEQYFDTVGTSIVQGRAFHTGDTERSRRVAVINSEFAKRYWPGQEPLGKRFRLGTGGLYVEVVGIARTGKYLSMAETPQPYVYLPFAQNPRSRMMLLVQTEGAAAGIVDPVLRAVHELDASQPVYNVRSIENYFDQGVLGPALILIQMVGTTGLIGLMLTLVGLYGLVSYSVSRRTREIGIRMALGAGRSTVLRLVMRQGLILSAIGAGIGIALSIPIFRVLSAGLSGVGVLSPVTLLLVPCALMTVTMCACWIPAWRAARIDPTRALRCD